MAQSTRCRRALTLALLGTAATCAIAGAGEQTPTSEGLRVDRVATAVPFPRGLAMVDGKLYVLARGRVRDAGGVSAAIHDRAGTIFIVDPDIAQPACEADVSEAVRNNGAVFAEPTEPPFHLWRRESTPPESDRETDRPYCTLRYHDGSRSFYICGFSGIDMVEAPDRPSFSKNCSDAVLRFDARTHRWYEVERHQLHAGGSYPHHDPQFNPPPHGWLNGPDNILVVGDSLYAVAKDNSRLVRYDLGALIDDPEAGCPASEVVFQNRLALRGGREIQVLGHSALAARDRWLYVGFRTSSQIIRIPIDDRGIPVRPVVAELVARFDPFDPKTRQSANITDMCFDSKGRLYVVCANGGIVHRFMPDPRHVHDGGAGAAPPWLHLGNHLGKPTLKCENVLIDRDRLFITSGDGYGYQAGADGTVYRVTINE